MKSIFIDFSIFIFKKLFRLNSANRFSCLLLENVDLVYTFKFDSFDIKISCPNRLNLDRAETYRTKEPDMIEWIDSFGSDVVFMDIGSNIGLYSIYAAKHGVKKVISIEPESQNYALFNKNVYLNGLSSNIVGLNIGISDLTRVETLYIPKFLPGAALNNIGLNINHLKEIFTEDYKQSVLSFSLDEFFISYPGFFPTHLKIDVDGVERKIINGGKKTFMDSRLNEVVIELNTDHEEDMQIVDIFRDCGLFLKGRYNSLSNLEFSHIYNYHFSRKL